jgi:hypothetical protein
MEMSSGTPPSEEPQKAEAKPLNCPHCGAAITLRALGQAVVVVCEGCRSILDAQDPQLKILQTFQKAMASDPPLIPLGSRGKIRGAEYEVIGVQRRSIKVEGIRYLWHEYVLFNPYKGFRYLTEFQGHWNDVVVCKDQPIVDARLSIPLEANYLGEIYQHFQTADANSDFVLGEFPWQVRVGDQARLTDYIHPPRVLSREKTGSEITWSIGEYVYGQDLWNTFHLPGSPPEAMGVYENQPSPVGADVKAIWVVCGAFLICLLALMIGFEMQSKKENVFSVRYHLGSGDPTGEASFVTDVFELSGRTSDVQVTTWSDLQNTWIDVNYALINVDTGRAWDFGREISFYSGYDSDGAWSEGNRTDQVTVPSVPSGRYYLRIEPEVEPLHPPIEYTVELQRDVPVYSFYGIGFLALILPMAAVTWRSFSFERSRWSESDHPPSPIFTSSEDDS